jgi:hypothetical protein
LSITGANGKGPDLAAVESLAQLSERGATVLY